MGIVELRVKKWCCIILMLCLSAAVLRADSAIQQAQEMLKEQGFYYGQITGEKNADTTAAIRRFQIRNGLQVTGELNDETLRALNGNSSAAVTAGSPGKPEPETEPRNDDLRDQIPPQPAATPHTAPPTPSDLSPPSATPRAAQPFPPSRAPAPPAPPRVSNDVFSDTPYATAPPQLQRQILADVETSLRRRGLYRGVIDGAYGPDLQFSLRTYQARIGLPSTGQLDMDTLASLGLLPGQHGPNARRQRVPLDEQPVHGEWVH